MVRSLSEKLIDGYSTRTFIGRQLLEIITMGSNSLLILEGFNFSSRPDMLYFILTFNFLKHLKNK